MSKGTCLVMDLCCMPVWASPWKPWLLLHWGYIGATWWLLYKVIVWLCYGYFMVMHWLLLWLLHHPGESLCYGCHASQERINLSALSSASQVSYQPLSLRLAWPGFSKQWEWCELWDNWHCEQDQQHSNWKDIVL